MPCIASGVDGREVQKNCSFSKIPKIRTKKILSFLHGLDKNTEILFIFDKIFSELGYQKLGGINQGCNIFVFFHSPRIKR